MAVKPKVPKDQPADEQKDSGADLSEFVEFTFMRTNFIIPRDRGDWSTEGLAWLAEKKFNLFVKCTLEIAKPGQWNVVVLLCPRRRDFAAFYAAFSQATQECFG